MLGKRTCGRNNKLVLEKLLERTQGKKDFITLDREFNMRLIAVAKRLLE
ncbi:hypothetical protein ACT7DJ_34635 [Bacillus cereus]